MFIYYILIIDFRDIRNNNKKYNDMGLINEPSKLITNVLGYPRIGAQRELKKACEAFWKGSISDTQLEETAKSIRKSNWERQQQAGINLIPSNDFSFYDTTLDLTLALGAIPNRYEHLKNDKLNLYFAMAHGYQKDGEDIIAMEMTKWFDTNYHYIVPEFVENQKFEVFDHKALNEFKEAKALGITTKPVILGPVSFLILGKEKANGFNRLSLIDNLLPAYIRLLIELQNAGAEWIQIDEPCLVTDISYGAKEVYKHAFKLIRESIKSKIILTTYFGSLGNNTELALSLPVDAIHIDLVRGPEQDYIIGQFPKDKILSLGIIDGRNIWKDDLEESISIVRQAACRLGYQNIIISPSCSFLHIPYDLNLEKNENVLTPEIKDWLAFTLQKTEELNAIKGFFEGDDDAMKYVVANKKSIEQRATSPLVHDKNVKDRCKQITESDYSRKSGYEERKKLQQAELHLPLFPTTTIGSFPQTQEVRSWRRKFKKGEVSAEEYKKFLEKETADCIKWQEKIGLDVLVHGEFERNDMVEYFGEQLSGFTFTQNGWVQSYGSRCVKPPVIFGDVSRKKPMTVDWSVYAQSCTKKPMKGMLTGPVTILEWSFVRNDQPRSATCQQIALAIRDEVNDLEKNKIKIIQVDEPAIREGLPLRKDDWRKYLTWAVDSFRLSVGGVKDDTQIHTHMCYSEFNDIIADIARMDADAITIECSRSQMELLDVFADFKYPNDIGPGVYDIHSARVPEVKEMVDLLNKALRYIPKERLWVNPDCGLKTRGWEETRASLKNMIEATKILRAQA